VTIGVCGRRLLVPDQKEEKPRLKRRGWWPQIPLQKRWLPEHMGIRVPSWRKRKATLLCRRGGKNRRSRAKPNIVCHTGGGDIEGGNHHRARRRKRRVKRESGGFCKKKYYTTSETSTLEEGLFCPLHRGGGR